MGREEERKGKKHRCARDVRDAWIGCLSHVPNWGPGPQPNQRPFSSQATTQPTEPHQLGLQ